MRTQGDFYFGEETATSPIILRPTRGESMRYGQQNIHIIDFPGEYDIDGHIVQCFATGDNLHYIFTIEDQRFALLQDTAILTKESFEKIDTWIVRYPSIKDELERKEMEGKVEVIS